MKTRLIEVGLSEDAARRYDEALTGDDTDVLLLVEKLVIGRLYPERRFGLQRVDADTDCDVVDVREGE